MIKNAVLCLGLIALQILGLDQALAQNARCEAPQASELPLLRDAKILTSKAELEEQARAIYASPSRLKGRAYQINHQLVIPYQGQTLSLPNSFIAGIQSHIQTALENKYADAVIYADLGHMHLLVPNEEVAAAQSLSSLEKMKSFMTSKNLVGLYHTVEMVKLKDGDSLSGSFPQDPWKLWRYFSRNFKGRLAPHANLEIIWAGEKVLYNTVRSLPGYAQVETIYFSANESGCIPYQSPNGVKYLDLTFETIPYM